MSNPEAGRPVSGELVPHRLNQPAPIQSTELNQLIRSGGYFESRRLAGQARQGLFDEQLRFLRQALALHNLAQLKRQQIEYHVALAEEIVARLTSTDNPLIELALQQAFSDWLSESRRIVSGLNW